MAALHDGPTMLLEAAGKGNLCDHKSQSAVQRGQTLWSLTYRPENKPTLQRGLADEGLPKSFASAADKYRFSFLRKCIQVLRNVG